MAKVRRKPAKRSAKKATGSVGAMAKRTRAAKRKAKSKPKAERRPTKPADVGSVPTITTLVGTVQDTNPKA